MMPTPAPLGRSRIPISEPPRGPLSRRLPESARGLSAFGAGDHLAAAFAKQIGKDGLLAPGDRLVIALSGGVDSSVLLHLFRFGAGLPELEIHAAHFDHGMRPDSASDSLWARGLCRAWQVPLHLDRARQAPTSEDDAREKRYDFLLRLREREKATWVVTGHQADDHAETVLFRICRGTGLRGLAGIPRSRPPGIYRPLLTFSRKEILEYASRLRVPFLRDPTNQDLLYPRNYLRHRILPELQAGPAPNVREALRRLARLAEENEAAWESLFPQLCQGVLVEENDSLFVVRSGLLTYHPAVQARVLREALRREGIELDEAGTRVALEFTRSGASGRSLSLPGGRLLAREFDRLFVTETTRRVSDQVLVITAADEGIGVISLGGRNFQVEWGSGDPVTFDQVFEAPVSSLQFPLKLKGWEPGDRIQLGYGTKKLKKLFSEAKVPLSERRCVPVLVDAEGRVLWVAGVAGSSLLQSQPGSGEPFFLGIRDADS